MDVGTKRIGVAISDELMFTAQGMDTIERKNLECDLGRIKELIEKNSITQVVLGLPINMNGTYGVKAKEVMEFLDSLSKAVNIPVKTWDERLTSLQADKIMLEADMSRAKRKRLSDKIAAQIILQNYLDSLKKKDNGQNA